MTTHRLNGSGRTTAWLAAGLFALAFVSVAGCGKTSGKASGDPAGGATTAPARVFAVEGMVCDGCVNTVTTAVKNIPGVQKVEVSLEAKKATVVADANEVPSSKIEEAIQAAGYKAQLIPPAKEKTPSSKEKQ